jgi:hypothetical protein
LHSTSNRKYLPVFSECQCYWVPVFSGSHSSAGASLQWEPVFSGCEFSVGTIVRASEQFWVFSRSECWMRAVFFQSTFYQKLKEARTEVRTGQSQSFFTR